jgi:hypothetical protein
MARTSADKSMRWGSQKSSRGYILTNLIGGKEKLQFDFLDHLFRSRILLAHLENSFEAMGIDRILVMAIP